MNLEKLSINTATFKNLSLRHVVDLCVKNNIKAIGPWRDKIHEVGLKEASRIINASGLQVSGLCRGGFFVADNNHNWDDNKIAIEEAAELNAGCLVIVSGGMLANNKNLSQTHNYIADGLAKMTELGNEMGVPIALEPLHPMYAADRCSINSLKHAIDICEQIGEGIGVAIDAYHVWWDPDVDAQIKRAGELGKIYGYHVCDWLAPTTDMLLDRGLMGDGVIDLKSMTQKIESTGHNGFTEVEIFSKKLWQLPPDEMMEKVIERFKNEV